MINISFAITVCNEAFELQRLLDQLIESVVKGDEIVIQMDQDNVTQEVLDVVSNFEGKYNGPNSRKKVQILSVIKILHPLNKDFASFKNNVKKHCTKDYVYFIDADEEVSKDHIDVIRQVLELNQNVALLWVPRINTVEGLTKKHIETWKWRVNADGWINWPDHQSRICKNIPEIRWEGKVHERLIAPNNFILPAEEIYALRHNKTITKQEQQNNFYSTL